MKRPFRVEKFKEENLGCLPWENYEDKAHFVPEILGSKIDSYKPGIFCHKFSAVTLNI